jgi:hypothetical protein
MAKTVEERVAALEARFAADEKKVDEVKKEEEGKTARESLLAEINQLDSVIASKLAADEKKEEDKEEVVASKELADKFNKKGSLVDPSGIEEQITQDKFHAVEDLEHGTELATDKTTLEAAPTGYVANLKQASERLDKVAAYLEKHGRVKEAFRIDKIADAIDQRIATIEKK